MREVVCRRVQASRSYLRLSIYGRISLETRDHKETMDVGRPLDINQKLACLASIVSKSTAHKTKTDLGSTHAAIVYMLLSLWFSYKETRE